MAETIADLFSVTDPRYIIFSNEKKRKLFMSEVAAFIDDVVSVKPDVLMYLDKSGRPLSWIVNDVWRQQHTGIKRPETKFINVGLEKVTPFNDSREQAVNNVWEPADVEKARDLFANKKGGTHLDGKHIWVVDEYSVTGSSLAAAKDLVSQVVGATSQDQVEARTVLSNEPFWYTYKHMIGVEDIDDSHFVSRPSGDSFQLRGELQMIASDMVASMTQPS